MNTSSRLSARAQGCKIRTAEGRELTDFVCAGGRILLGHADPDVVSACAESAALGLSSGMPNEGEASLSKLLLDCVPFIEQAALAESFSEALKEALRIAVLHTQKSALVTFEGGPDPSGYADPEFELSWGDAAGARALFQERRGEIAAVLAAPVSPRMGFMPPSPGFLKLLRGLCDECGALLIFDEELSAFRYGFSAYAVFCGIRPDLFCFGGLLGGGLPLGAVGGRAELLASHRADYGVSPVAAGTGLAALLKIERLDIFARIDSCVRRVQAELNGFARENDLDFHVAAEAGMFTPFFRKDIVGSFADAKDCDTNRYGMFQQRMLDRGFYLPRRQNATAFVTAAHEDEEIDLFIAAAQESLEETFEML